MLLNAPERVLQQGPPAVREFLTRGRGLAHTGDAITSTEALA